MPPIPVYTKSPINAAKASGVTPQTAEAPDSKGSNNPPTTTTQLTPTKTTSTSYYNGDNNNSNSNIPPPPQPGAVPHLPQVTGTATASGSSLPPGPPPPAPTAAAQLPGSTYSPIPPVPQTAFPPPATPLNQRGTSTHGSGFTPNRTGVAVLPGVSPYETGGPSGAGGGYSAPAPYRDGGNDGEEGEGVLGSAMKFARAAGEKLSAAESEVWKRINGEK